MECGLGEERHWGKLWLIPALIFGIGIFSTFFVTSSNLTASQVVAGAFGIENINLGSFKVEGVIVMGVLLCIPDLCRYKRRYEENRKSVPASSFHL